MDDSAAPNRPARMLFPTTWHPPADAFFAVVFFYGPQEQVMQRVEEFTRSQPHVVLHFDPTMELPSDAWDRLPPRFLTNIQQAVVREDLRGTKREVIAEKLIISPNTGTS
ncbi:MAG: hypothetical protein OHK0022_43260 [Roseiflexaceae bacterium]